MKKLMLSLLIPLMLLSGCGQPKYTAASQNPTFIVVTQYQDYYQEQSGKGAAPLAHVVTSKSAMNEIVAEINSSGKHIMPSHGTTSCPNATTDLWYDIVIHYPNFERTFTLNDAGCTLLHDEKDGIILYGDVPAIKKLFN